MLMTPDAGCSGEACVPASCAALECGDHRLCELTSAGPVCLDACEGGFELDPTIDACTACARPDCAPPPTCEPGAPGSIGDQCDAEHRVCADDGTGAACGACAPGYHLDAETMVCVEDAPACDGDGGCPPMCPDGSALGPDGCAPCGIVCGGGEGELASVHARRDALGECICETEDGYYWSFTQRLARPCNVDGDDWLARGAYEAMTSNDPAVAEVARCDLAAVDRVVLENEYGQQRTLFLCAQGVFAEGDPAAATCTASPLPLVEPDRNDSDVALAAAAQALAVPEYGAGPSQRMFEARELNALTKACATVGADYDAAGGPDIDQVQPTTKPLVLLDGWQAFSYFVELHTAELVTPTLGMAGSLVIRERSRCLDGAAGGVPIGPGPDDGGAYERECTRRRDARYDVTSPEPGFDFARFSCAAGEGSCDVPDPPLGGEAQADGSLAHGLCNGPAPTDAFLGMHHHSQFKCMRISGESDRSAFERPLEAFATDANGYLSLYACDSAPAPVAEGAPTFTCAFEASPTFGDVGWAAVRFSSTTTYDGSDRVPVAPGGSVPPLHDVAGCVPEAPWAPLFCPADGPKLLDGALAAFSDPNDAGQLVCACPNPRSPTDAPECGGQDDVVFVAAAPIGDDANSGAHDSPVATIAKGIAMAGASGRHHVIVSVGTYRERVQVSSGIHVHGGYDAGSWIRSASGVSRIQPFTFDIAGAVTETIDGQLTVTGGRLEGVVAESITAPTVFESFTIEVGSGASAPGGIFPTYNVSVYGVRVVDSTAGASGGLILRDLDVTAGLASPGLGREPGADGHAGSPGQSNGLSGDNHGGGAAGTNSQCPIGTILGEADSTSGGRGGDGGNGDSNPSACGGGRDGHDGALTANGFCLGGAGGDAGKCGINARNATRGKAPPACNAALYSLSMDGADGGPPADVGDATSGVYTAHAGISGIAGTNGVGGAGGGGGGGGTWATGAGGASCGCCSITWMPVLT
jgi:hypothetical protein